MGNCQGCFIKYLEIGGCSSGFAFNPFADSGHSKGKCTTLPGFLISANACKVEVSTANWPALSPGCPSRYPSGYSIAARRGTPTEAVKSGMQERVIVLIPATSISLCTSPTDQQQTGQPGTNRTTSTWSCFICSIMAGSVSSKSTWGCKMYPI